MFGYLPLNFYKNMCDAHKRTGAETGPTLKSGVSLASVEADIQKIESIAGTSETMKTRVGNLLIKAGQRLLG